MGFTVIPAIDISQAGLMRLGEGSRVSVEAFDGDPVEAARSFIDAGAEWIHVVDMDLAFDGELANLWLIEQIAALGIRVQASGGVASRDEVMALLDVGVRRVVLGSAGLVEELPVRMLITELDDALAIGLEAEGDRLIPRGRAEDVSLDAEATVAWLLEAGAARFVRTSVSRVGELTGPDIEGTRALAARGVPVIAAGGVASEADLRALAAAGAEGAILGRVLYEEELDLAAALKLTEEL